MVTGSAGFIGSHFCRYILDKYPSATVIGVDSLTYAGNMITMSDFIENSRFHFYKIDIRDKENLTTIFNNHKIDYVVNFAAESHVDRSIINPGDFLTTNILGTQVLMDLAMKYNVQRFHQVSTDEVYGDLPLNDLSKKFSETTPLNPSSPYSASKASADFLVNAYHRTYGLPISISRCSNNYGPYQYPEKLIPVIIDKALKNMPIPVYGKGINVRDWLYVEDHCSAIDLILKHGNNGETYNIGGNTELSNIDLVNQLLDILEKPKSLISYVEDRKGHDLRYAIDFKKIHDDLGWEPQHRFKDALKHTVNWYKHNPKWVLAVSSE